MIEQAIKIILSKCSSEISLLAMETQKAFREGSVQVGQLRYSRLLEQAFASGVDFSPEERAVLASCLEEVAGDKRSEKLTIRLSPGEKDSVMTAADKEKLSLSDYARKRLLGKG